MLLMLKTKLCFRPIGVSCLVKSTSKVSPIGGLSGEEEKAVTLAPPLAASFTAAAASTSTTRSFPGHAAAAGPSGGICSIEVAEGDVLPVGIDIGRRGSAMRRRRETLIRMVSYEGWMGYHHTAVPLPKCCLCGCCPRRCARPCNRIGSYLYRFYLNWRECRAECIIYTIPFWVVLPIMFIMAMIVELGSGNS